MNEIITNIVNETNAKAKTTSVPPRNLTNNNWCYLHSDSEDEEENWKQRILDFYGTVVGPKRISRTPVINMKELQN